jgi:hypothetical protein
VLTERQRDAVAYFQAYSAPATWVLAESDVAGHVTVTAMTSRGTWTYLLAPDGSCRHVPAPVGAPLAPVEPA